MAGRRKLEKLADFKRALKQNYGLGEGASYTPWIRVQDVKSHGHSGKIEGIKSGRTHHTLSEHESCFFYLAEFSDSVIDIREQFPLLPLSLSLKISQSLSVEHPKHPITKDPIIMTTDFLLTCSDGQRVWYEAVCVKPREKLSDKRTAEKLDIERVWWELLGVPFHIFYLSELNQIKSKNIQWITDVKRKKCPSTLNEFRGVAKHLLTIGTMQLNEICEIFSHEIGISQDDALVLLKSLLADKEVTVDLSRPIVLSGMIEIMEIKIDGNSKQHAAS
ncbi:heteromeric transposase endonuclease subunit TnsA [Vibrio parahaemolyticus]|uniref:heteromeric transposase endonuclease subunit TnsA n=1 Tax=Vibrio harveyi group TaxID=717610 RepID=UPI0004714518|nr:heteromeric transposase endonuclease subunit TnsA [Vibrio parahaemolyticus]EGR1560720.1 heteromeric transposase endonuclease subunit TnsA [Vibrio alginolyticus]EHK0751396.1 heteromeric transposase endonuclease subunit TnsA [Vibrio parahaemolyticus]EHK7403538.1 heteromeric transposase endonuclease subunit TnsA [Vibrio parahaemolyticus]EJB8688689.1 heteromeric transposase endonuclease subunit TnsA [Vibrio parahaemolyticus]MQP54741.1 heteromeric transposase endonuclease subunit TnsA [Vibrio pa